MRLFAYLGGGILALALALFAGLVATIRTGYRPVLDRVRHFNRAYTNPKVMRTAGEPGASASIIRHTGRSSGRQYETPVGVMEVGDDYLITLPYGTSADWVKNVLAAGAAEVVHEGRTVPVGDPELVSAGVVSTGVPAREILTQRLYGIDQMLRLRPRPSV
ncbi:MAG TPA: nitroreductase family deazaflavin-dependent oxidoreductase [Acidimicrobiia bacterium]|nr:nitroreductase family deazaflavin-dependent oxidoreductase [Acidimicrobiia bacterium]